MESYSKHPLSLPNFCKRRLTKVYLPVLLVTVIWIPTAVYFDRLEIRNATDLLYVLLWGFNDGALWFVKTILILYVFFYIFAYTRQKSKVLAHIFLVAAICVLYAYNHSHLGSWSTPSLPLFYLGTLLSLNKRCIKNGVLAPTAATMVAVCVVSFWQHGITLVVHTFINYVAILAMLLVAMGLCKKDIRIKFPAVLGALSFDVYLVHNKVLYVMKDNMEFLPVWQWILVTAVATGLFYMVRMRLLPVNGK